MVQIMEAAILHAVLIVVLCGPPLLLFQTLVRRRQRALPEHQRYFRIALVAAVAAFAFNLGVATFGAPRFQIVAISDGIDAATLLALALSWVSLWGAVALPVLLRRRRYKLAL